jgi:NitT/TauT family transport system substrate-binding protein
VLNKKIAIIFVIISMFALCFVGCGNNGGDQSQNTNPVELQKVRLSEVVRSVFYAPMYVAINKGFFEEAGIEIDLSTAQGGDKAMTALVSNNADIALIGSETTIYVYQQGSENLVINFAQLTQKDGSFLVSREPYENFTWSETRGKTIVGGRLGGMPEMVMQYVLTKNGVIPYKDVEIINNISFTATAGAFAGGTGDFTREFEPTASILEKEGVGTVVASIGEDSGIVPYTVFMATEKYIKENPELIQRFTDVVYRAQIWCYEHSPEEIATEMAPFFEGVDMEILTNVCRRYQSIEAWAPNPILQPEAFDLLQEIMLLGGVITEKVPYNKLVTTEFAEEAIKKVK